MELKNLMKEVVKVLEENGTQKASLQLHLNLENEKVEVAPYGSALNFKINMRYKGAKVERG